MIRFLFDKSGVRVPGVNGLEEKVEKDAKRENGGKRKRKSWTR